MESELHKLIREACGGTRNNQADEIWKLIQKEIEDATEIFRSANAGLRRQLDEIAKQCC